MADKELQLKCECKGGKIKFGVFIDEPEIYCVSCYTLCLNNNTLWERIKNVFKPKPFCELILSSKSMLQLKNYIEETLKEVEK